VLLFALAGCPREVGPPAFDTLVGLEAPLVPGPGLRVSVEGRVGAQAAEVVIDVASPMSLVTKGCFEQPMVSGTTVKVVDPMGGEDGYRVTRVAALTVAGRRLVPTEAGLAEGERCAVVVGTDLLVDTAVQVDPTRRVVRFVRSRPRAEWVSVAETLGGEVQVLELSRDPRHDWPLLAARLSQRDATITGAFVFSTRDRVSRVFEAPAQAAGFTTTAELLQKLELPKEVKLPIDLAAFQGMVMDKVELSPGVGAQGVSFAVQGGAPAHGVDGVLAADAWGRFELTIDVASGVLLLHRPRVLSAGQRFQCGRGQDTPTEDACFELTQTPARPGVVVTGTIWRPLPTGGRLYLDFPDASPTCRVGFTFDAGDRGRNTQHLVPWPRLFESMKPCADSLATATRVSLALFEDSPLKECPGVCAFAQDLRTGRVSCECQPGPLGLSAEAERTLLEKLRGLLKKPDEGPPEPGDPPP
jgi:hypothetical protein